MCKSLKKIRYLDICPICIMVFFLCCYCCSILMWELRVFYLLLRSCPKSMFIEYSSSVSCSVMSDSLQSHRLQPARLLCPWDSPGKNTGVDCQSLLQRIFLAPGIEPGSSALQADSLLFEQQRRPQCLHNLTI